MGRLPLLLLLEVGLRASGNSEERTTVGSGAMGPSVLRLTHQDQTEGPLHSGQGPLGLRTRAQEDVYLFLFCLTASSHSAQLAGVWASLGSEAMGPMSRRSSSCCRTGGPGAQLDQGPWGPWTGVTGRRQTALSAITSSGISSRRSYEVTKIFIQRVLIEIVDDPHPLPVYNKQKTNFEVLGKMTPHAKVIYVVWGVGVPLVDELQQLWLRRLGLWGSSSSGS